MKTKHRKLRHKPLTPFKPLTKGQRGGIELLLVHNVEHVGKQGQVVEVKKGYAYNYLIPQGLATQASDHHKRMVDKHKVKLQQIEVARQAELRKQAAELRKSSPRSKPTTSISRPTRSASKARSRNSACTR